MDFGLLWYDGDPTRPLEEKVKQAATRYADKFGQHPDVCFVHPAEAGTSGIDIPTGETELIRVLGAPNCLRNHFYVGRRDA
jgi:hypothetical protein